MRIDDNEFDRFNKSVNREPVFVVELSLNNTNTDQYYLTSHEVDGLTGNIINDTLTIVSSQSQKINPLEARSTIGSIEFRCLDEGITELIRSKLVAGHGIRGKRVRFYQGYKGLLWDQFRLIQTQIVSNSVRYRDGVYTFRCADVQREMRKQILVPKETRLTQTLAPDADTITVRSTEGFELVYQVPSAKKETLLRQLQAQMVDGNPRYPVLTGKDHIGLLRIGNGEIVIWTAKTATTFTGLVRGVLGAPAEEVEVRPEDGVDKEPVITEYIYLGLPAVKAAYALLTGSLYGHAGEFLPDGWHLGISTDYVQTSAFVNIGDDLWDLNDDDNGFAVDIRGLENQDGKKFIEEKIYFLIGVFSPVTPEGELSLKRLRPINAEDTFDRVLNKFNIVEYGDLEHDISQTQNNFAIRWNQDGADTGKLTRTSKLLDTASVAIHGVTPREVIELPTLHGSRHAHDRIRHHFNTLRLRYSAPPVLLDLTLTPDQNDLEVGDVVRVQLDHIQDYTGTTVGAINRNFEVQEIKNDWSTGEVQVSLFGSSVAAGNIAPDRTESVPDDFFDALGVSLITLDGTTGVPAGSIVTSDGITTIVSNITLTGHANNIRDTSSVFYCLEDLVVAPGVTVTINGNVQLRVKGFCSIEGDIDGKGRGGAGGTVITNVADIDEPLQVNKGAVGRGSTFAGGGWARYTKYYGTSQSDPGDGESGYFHQFVASGVHHNRIPSVVSRNTIGVDKYSNRRPLDGNLRNYAITIADDGELLGMPQYLHGSGGPSGMPVYHMTFSSYTVGSPVSYDSIVAQGGAGGAGGAGLAIFAKGVEFGPNTVIDLSGNDGAAGSAALLTEGESDTTTIPAVGDPNVIAGGGGGGAPGCLLIGILDSEQASPAYNSENVICKPGVSPHEETTWVSMNHWKSFWRWAYDPNASTAGNLFLPASSPLIGQLDPDAGDPENRWYSNVAIYDLDQARTPAEDEKDYVDGVPTFTLTEYTNTPVTVPGNISTIEVSVTPPADTNYAYALVDYRVLGTTGWLTTSASNEALIQVESDGSTYEVQVRAVSTKGFASPTGPVDTITVTDVNGRTDDELDDIYPFYPITGLSLQNETGDIFTGRDAAFEWSHDNAALIYFNYYEIEMYSGAQLLRTEKSASPFFNYAYEKNALDYQRINGVPGIYWELEIRVKAVSKILNSSDDWYSGPQVSFEVTAPVVAAPEVTLSYSGANVVLTWPNYGNQFLTITTTLEYGGNVIQETTGNSFTVPVDWIGSRTFNVRAAHLPTHSSTVVEVVVSPTPPGVPVVSSQVIANNVLFNYASTPGSLPIDRYEIRRGGTYNGGTTPDTKAGTSSFTVYTETVAATIVFWFEAVDTAGNHGGYVSSSVSVSSPPNYQLLATYSAKDAGWPGTKTNALVTETGSLLVPVNTTETFQQHFDNNSWSTPQDQVTAGYEYYIQPSTNSAQYVVTYDYGSSIDSAIISATTAPVVFDGSVTAQVTLAWSPDNSSWTSATAGQTQALATNFRYARVTIDITASGGDDLAYIEDVLIKLDKQIDEDFGLFTADSADTNGTFIAFNKDFIDAQTPTVTINTASISGSTASSPIRAEGIVRFVDEPDPTGFYLYVYNAATGARVTASGSWHAYGFTRT